MIWVNYRLNVGEFRTEIVQDVAPTCLNTIVVEPDEAIEMTLTAARDGAGELQSLIESLAMPIYLTDAAGWITHFNRACIDFAGRTPIVGQDRWCVSWRLYTEDGQPLPHDHCPMAESIRQMRPVRGAVAVAERPDGRRVLFTPHPTPIIGETGELCGAVNILIDVTDRRQADALRAQALRCRRLAQAVTDSRTIDTLRMMEAEYEEQARRLDDIPS